MGTDLWVVDLCCGSGGWTDGFLRHGYRVTGVDVKRDFRYRGEFILGDVSSLDGAPFAGARVIVASPPCQDFSQAKRPFQPKNHEPDLSVILACFRIAREAAVPIVLENVHGAQRWLGPSRHHWGKFHLWGDGVPALLPEGPRWKDRQKMKHRSPMLRARIPDELSDSVAIYYKEVFHGTGPTSA